MSNPINKIALGKELVFSKKVINKFMKEEFSYNTKIQNIWLEDDNIHIRVFNVANKNSKNPLKEHGFEEMKKPSDYRAIKKVDDRFKQIIQSIKLLNFSM